MPVRMCCICRARLEKAEMIRVACPKEGEPQLDLRCSSSGRGAYFCSVTCLKQAEKRRALERAFGRRVGSEDYARILEGAADGQS